MGGDSGDGGFSGGKVCCALAQAVFEQGIVNLALKTASELLEISGFVVDVSIPQESFTWTS